MNYEELYNILLTDVSFTYPFNYTDKKCDYLDYVWAFGKAYLDLIGNLDAQSIIDLEAGMTDEAQGHNTKPFKLLDDARQFYEITMSCINQLFAGCSQVAFEKLEKFLTENTYHYMCMLPHLYPDGHAFYKIRPSQSFAVKDGEMFHLPFELRHNVSTQRYSVPGYPTLYLAGNPDTGRREVGGNDWDGVTCCTFRFKGEAKFFDIGYPTSNEPGLWELYSLFACYPLLMACMVSVKHKDAPYKPEYALPQLLFNVVRMHNHEGFAGIAYMSNKADSRISKTSFSRRNFALFIKRVNEAKGYDNDLASKLQVSEFLRMNTIQLEQLRKMTSGREDLLVRHVRDIINDLPMHDMVL